MMKIVMSTALILSIFFQSCKSKELMQNDIIGTWLSSDGDIMELNKDSSFIGKLLLAEYFTFFTLINDIQSLRIIYTLCYHSQLTSYLKNISIKTDISNNS